MLSFIYFAEFLRIGIITLMLEKEANAVACQMRGSREKVPHLFSFLKSSFLRSLIPDKMPQKITSHLFSVNSPVAWSRSVTVGSCDFRTPRTMAIGLALHILQSVSDGVVHNLRRLLLILTVRGHRC